MKDRFLFVEPWDVLPSCSSRQIYLLHRAAVVDRHMTASWQLLTNVLSAAAGTYSCVSFLLPHKGRVIWSSSDQIYIHSPTWWQTFNCFRLSSVDYLLMWIQNRSGFAFISNCPVDIALKEDFSTKSLSKILFSLQQRTNMVGALQKWTRGWMMFRKYVSLQ